MDQMHLFPELDPYLTKIKDVDYVDLQQMKWIDPGTGFKPKHDYSMLPENTLILFKSGGRNQYMPDEGDAFPYLQNKKTGRTLHFKMTDYEYPTHNYGYKDMHWKFRIHKLTAQAFIENDNPKVKTIVDHINGKRWDWRVSNLRWSSPSENAKNKKKGQGRDIENMMIHQKELFKK